MTLFIIILISLLLAIPCLVAVVSVLWAASGSSDVNGDPERDAGHTEDEIQELFRHWDRGSCQTELRPNLEYARLANRRHLARSISR